MIMLFRLALRNALRNGRRTFLTAATVTIGTAMTVLTLSFLDGMIDGMIVDYAELNGMIRVVDADYLEREALRPLHENIPEADPVLEKVRAIPGVAQAEPLVRTGVIVSKGEELGEDPALLTGSSKEWYATRLLPDATFVAGAWLADTSDDEQIVLGSKVARDLSAVVGEEILVMGTTQYGSMAPISAQVIGIVTGNSTIDNQAFVTLEVARWMVDVPDGAIELVVYADDLSDSTVGAASQRLNDALGPELVAQPWYLQPIWVQTVPIMKVMKLVISSIVVFLMALAIFNTMTMSVLERTGEIGVMRAMGQSRASAVLTFLAEALMIGLLGGIMGAALGAIPAYYFEVVGFSYSQDVIDEMGGDYPIASTLYGDLTLDTLLLALVVGLLTAALGAVLPAIRAARVAPYEAMRATKR